MATGKSTIESSLMEKSEIHKKPERILLFSGKRKSGKDYITDKLYKRIAPGKCGIIKISAPIKSHFARSLNLDINELMSDGEYKEKYRKEMVQWGERTREKDYGYFCRSAIEMYHAEKYPIWIVSDIRRKTDIQWFSENYEQICKTIRIFSSEETRKNRGWVFLEGVDDAETECDLDDVKNWDLEIANDNEDIEVIINKILKLIE